MDGALAFVSLFWINTGLFLKTGALWCMETSSVCLFWKAGQHGHVCQSVAKQQGSCTNGGPFGLDLSPNCRKTERSLLFEENVLLCNLIPAVLWCPCVLFALGLQDDRARWWSVWNNSCWLLFLNLPCFVETFKAIPDWSLSRLLLKVGIMSFLVYWLTEWGNNSDGIWCHNPSGGFTWSWRLCSQGFTIATSSDETKIFKAYSYFWKRIILPSIRSLGFKNKRLSSPLQILQLIDFTVKTKTSL